MTIKNKKSGIVIQASTGTRNGYTIVKFMGVTIKLDSTFFKKHWEVIK